MLVFCCNVCSGDFCVVLRMGESFCNFGAKSSAKSGIVFVVGLLLNDINMFFCCFVLYFDLMSMVINVFNECLMLYIGRSSNSFIVFFSVFDARSYFCYVLFVMCR